MFHKKYILCKIITTGSVIAPKLVFFVDKCYTYAIYLFFSTPLRGFMKINYFVKSQLPYP